MIGKHQIFLFLFIAVMFSLVQAQGILKQSFRLQNDADDQPFEEELHGYGIVDLLVRDSIVWAASGYALNKTIDDGTRWQVFRSEDYIGKGGVSALGYMDDSTLWIATAYDTTVREDNLTAGGGLSFTRDGGKTWTHFKQPLDARDVTDYSPTTTNIQNITYDIAFVDSTIWIASFGGGLRRSDDMGQTWQVVTTDGIPFSSLQYLNHRAFSLLNENGNLWVGTAHGISRSEDNGQTWERFTAQNQEQAISGNFVVAFGYQEYNGTVWAATIEATDTSEFRAVSKTSNGGQTWEVVLKGTFAHNFGFDGSRVYVAADEGLFISEDDGQNWYEIPQVRSAARAEELFGQKYYSVAAQYWQGIRRLWLGTSRGLAVTEDNGNSWQIISAYVSGKRPRQGTVYAYPSPFTPRDDIFCRFQVDVTRAQKIDIKIYDFAMNQVRDIPIDDYKPKWDGRSDSGATVASGVYFFRAEVDGEVSWGKIVIVN